MKKDIRLRKFYTLLDRLISEEVECMSNSINDGDWNELKNRQYNESDRLTFENYGTTIYDCIIDTDDFRFLTKIFIMQEIEKYFNIPGYWSEIRQKYKLD